MHHCSLQVGPKCIPAGLRATTNKVSIRHYKRKRVEILLVHVVRINFVARRRTQLVGRPAPGTAGRSGQIARQFNAN